MSNGKKIIDSFERDGFKVEVIQYEGLGGGADLDTAKKLYYADKMGIKLKQVLVTLNDSSLITESGALQFMKGDLELKAGLGVSSAGGILKKLASSALTNESFTKPIYKGTGRIFLEPSFNHYIIMELNNEEMVVDKGIFYACESTIEVGVERVKNLTAMVAGGEGLFQTKLSGTGVCVLEIPVPASELMKFNLNGDTMQVDGSFVVARKGNIDFTVERSSKSLIGTASTGEGLLQTFRGHGEIIIAPTQPVYESLAWKTYTSSTQNQ